MALIRCNNGGGDIFDPSTLDTLTITNKTITGLTVGKYYLFCLNFNPNPTNVSLTDCDVLWLQALKQCPASGHYQYIAMVKATSTSIGITTSVAGSNPTDNQMCELT